MRLLNPSQIGVAPFVARPQFPKYHLTLVAKLLVRLHHDAPCELITGAASLPCGDVPYPDDTDGTHEPRYPSDFVPIKSRPDVVIVGHFHAPKGPVRVGHVGVQVGTHQHQLQVVGERTWQPWPRRRGQGASQAPPSGRPAPPPPYELAAPFETLQLRWCHALGGPHATMNPVGTGLLDPNAAPEAVIPGAGLRLPRIEPYPQRSAANHKPEQPAGFGATPMHWSPRSAYLGTLDERWQAKHFPGYPADFDPRFFNTSHHAFQDLNHLQGDEALCLDHLHPTIPRYRCQLPGLRATAAIARKADADADASSPPAFTPLPLTLDTLWLDMDAELAVLLYRGQCECADARMSDLSHAYVGLDSLATAPSSDVAVCEAALRCWADDEAQWQFKAAPATPPLPEFIDTPPPAAAELTRNELLAAIAQGPIAPGTNLSGLDLAGADLSEAVLRGVILDGADLSNANLSGADLAQSSLRQALLSAATLDNTQLTAADLTGAQAPKLQAAHACFDKAILRHASLEGASLCQTSLQAIDATRATFNHMHCDQVVLDKALCAYASFESATFKRSSLCAVNLANAVLSRASFADTQLIEADLPQSNLAEAAFVHSNLTDADLERAQAPSLRLESCQIQGLRMARAAMPQAHFKAVEGADCIFTDCNLEDARIDACHLPGTDLSRANLHKLAMRSSMLRSAKFDSCQLVESTLTQCDFFGASFEAANLQRCQADGASFYGAEFLEANTASFQGVGRDLHNTKLATKDQEPEGGVP